MLVSSPSTAAPTPDDLEGLRIDILRRIASLVRGAGLAEHEIGCELVGDPRDLTVTLIGPGIAGSVLNALSVRVLDAVHADGRTFGNVAVTSRFDGPLAT